MTETQLNESMTMDTNKVFSCPFNAYHKMYDLRKFQFHVARCKDRRGKTVWHCNYSINHIFTDQRALHDHEKICDKKIYAKSESEAGEETADDKKEPDFDRKPFQCYCAYNCEHAFKTIKEREFHEQVCPNKTEVLKRDAKCQGVYAKLKNELKKKQQTRKDQHMELYGQHNGPKAQELPVLRYKYQMNEPFLQGNQGQYATSIEQMDYKKRAIYGLTTVEEQPSKEEDFEQILEQCKGKPLPDINVFMVKHDGEDLYGLTIRERTGDRQNQWFEFEIQEYISLSEFLGVFQVSIEQILHWDHVQWVRFLTQNRVLKLDIPSVDKNHEWNILARQQIDSFVLMQQLSDENQRRTICMHTKMTDTQEIYLFLINKSSEAVGQFLDSDFALLQLAVDICKQDERIVVVKQQPKIENAEELERDRQDLETRLKDCQNEIAEFVKNQETLEKIIKDKDRQTKQDKKQIEFLDNSIKHTRGDLRSTQEMLEAKESQVRDLEKEIENLQSNIKSFNVRFDREKKKADTFEEKLNTAEAQLKKAFHFLTEGNKAIKLKDTAIKQQNEKILKLNNFIKQFSATSDGKTLSMESINAALNQQPTTLVLNAPNEKATDDQYVTLKTKIEQGDTDILAKMEDLTKDLQKDKLTFKPVASQDAEMDDQSIMEGEIMDGEEDPEQIRINKLQQLATKTLNPQPVTSQNASKSKTMSAPSSKVRESKGKQVNKFDGPLPENMMCVLCLERPKEVLIQTCKHLVFCHECELQYALKHGNDKECPICRKKYAKTLKVMFS